MIRQKNMSQAGITRFSVALWLGVAGWLSGGAIAACLAQAAEFSDPSAQVAQADRPAAGGTVNVPALETLPRLDPQPSSATQAAPSQLVPSPEPSPQPSPESAPIAPSLTPNSTLPASVPVNVPPASPAPASNIIEFGQPLPR
jgi:hypothetical protein